MHTISYVGKIVFNPENKTNKHLMQASWKKVAMIVFEGDITDYYSWFMKERFSLELNKPLRGAHVTFINDKFEDINKKSGTREEKELLWEELKKKWDGKEIEVTFNLRPFYDLDSSWKRHIPRLLTEKEKLEGKVQKTSHTYHWWLIVDHKFRDEIHDIRKEIGLEKPYFGLHMTFGILNQNYKLDNEGKLELGLDGMPIPIFNHQLEHAKYLDMLHESGFIEMNKDYFELPVSGGKLKDIDSSELGAIRGIIKKILQWKIIKKIQNSHVGLIQKIFK